MPALFRSTHSDGPHAHRSYESEMCRYIIINRIIQFTENEGLYHCDLNLKPWKTSFPSLSASGRACGTV